jgi:hypothetical protein
MEQQCTNITLVMLIEQIMIKRIPKKFILHFFELYMIYYDFF